LIVPEKLEENRFRRKGQRTMPIYFWWLQKGILLTKKARLVAPAIFTSIGAAAVFIFGRIRKKRKENKTAN